MLVSFEQGNANKMIGLNKFFAYAMIIIITHIIFYVVINIL